MRCLRRISSAVDRGLTNFYRSLGRFIARRPWLVIFVCAALTLACCAGFLRFEVVEGAERLYTPQDAPSFKDKAYVEANYPSTFLTVKILSLDAAQSGGSVLTRSHLLEHLRAHAGVVGQVVGAKGSDYSWRDVCDTGSGNSSTCRASGLVLDAVCPAAVQMLPAEEGGEALDRYLREVPGKPGSCGSPGLGAGGGGERPDVAAGSEHPPPVAGPLPVAEEAHGKVIRLLAKKAYQVRDEPTARQLGEVTRETREIPHVHLLSTEQDTVLEYLYPYLDSARREETARGYASGTPPIPQATQHLVRSARGSANQHARRLLEGVVGLIPEDPTVGRRLRQVRDQGETAGPSPFWPAFPRSTS
ncbi:hypothetical protein PLESTM_001884700 [Pleodorina starrii]|nr:hypothetical protein PLESTM_001884700 [Pleodorina starrii]